MAPFGQMSRPAGLKLGSHFGRNHGGETARIPDSPSTIVPRTSPSVRPIKAMRTRPSRATSRTHSAPTRVLPQPRPQRASHSRQSPGGASWSSRAQNGQSYSRAASSSAFRLASHARRCASGSEASELALKRGADFVKVQVHDGVGAAVLGLEAVAHLQAVGGGVQ